MRKKIDLSTKDDIVEQKNNIDELGRPKKKHKGEPK